MIQTLPNSSLSFLTVPSCKLSDWEEFTQLTPSLKCLSISGENHTTIRIVGKFQQAFDLIPISCPPLHTLNRDSKLLSLYVLSPPPPFLDRLLQLGKILLRSRSTPQFNPYVHLSLLPLFFVSMKRWLLSFTKRILCSGSQLVLQLSSIKFYLLFHTRFISPLFCISSFIALFSAI